MARTLADHPMPDAEALNGTATQHAGPSGLPDGWSAFDLDAPWQLHPRVAMRPEPFGAMLYHFDTRRLTFLKTANLARVVQSLDGQPSARAALNAADIPAGLHSSFSAALEALARTSMICRRPAEGESR